MEKVGSVASATVPAATPIGEHSVSAKLKTGSGKRKDLYLIWLMLKLQLRQHPTSHVGIALIVLLPVLSSVGVFVVYSDDVSDAIRDEEDIAAMRRAAIAVAYEGDENYVKFMPGVVKRRLKGMLFAEASFAFWNVFVGALAVDDIVYARRKEIRMMLHFHGVSSTLIDIAWALKYICINVYALFVHIAWYAYSRTASDNGKEILRDLHLTVFLFSGVLLCHVILAAILGTSIRRGSVGVAVYVCFVAFSYAANFPANKTKDFSKASLVLTSLLPSFALNTGLISLRADEIGAYANPAFGGGGNVPILTAEDGLLLFVGNFNLGRRPYRAQLVGVGFVFVSIFVCAGALSALYFYLHFKRSHSKELGCCTTNSFRALFMGNLRRQNQKNCCCKNTFQEAPASDGIDQRLDADRVLAISLNNVCGEKYIYRHKRRMRSKDAHLVTINTYFDEISIILGATGDAQSTILSLIAGMQSKRGAVSMYGANENDHVTMQKRNFGVCLNVDVLWDGFTIRQHVEIIETIKCVPESDVSWKICRKFGFAKNDRRRNWHTQKRSVQRVLSVCLAFVADSKLVVLDQPTQSMNGSDRLRVRETLRELKSGRSIVVATDSFEEATQLGDRFYVVSDGRVAWVGTREHLQRQLLSGHVFRIWSSCDLSVLDVTWSRRFATGKKNNFLPDQATSGDMTPMLKSTSGVIKQTRRREFLCDFRNSHQPAEFVASVVTKISDFSLIISARESALEISGDNLVQYNTKYPPQPPPEVAGRLAASRQAVQDVFPEAKLNGNPRFSFSQTSDNFALISVFTKLEDLRKSGAVQSYTINSTRESFDHEISLQCSFVY